MSSYATGDLQAAGVLGDSNERNRRRLRLFGRFENPLADRFDLRLLSEQALAATYEPPLRRAA
ncbi:MAG: hypothetical protein IH891_03820 [Planctomycetes bacterium]|nr:hypothetical protein [Planctomycetota bacterium]